MFLDNGYLPVSEFRICNINISHTVNVRFTDRIVNTYESGTFHILMLQVGSRLYELFSTKGA